MRDIVSDRNMQSGDLERLVQQRLIERSDALSPAATAAFVDGWMSLLELLERTDLTLAQADPAVREAVADLAARIRAAQARVLDDEG